MTDSVTESMRRLSADIRIQTIHMIAGAGAGHIGGSMSIADVLGVLYGGAMRVDPQNPCWEERDWLVISKGHCGPALYAALALKGFFPMEMLATLNKPDTKLPSHCDRLKTPGVDMSTGSLGQGISSAVGISMANRFKGKDSYTYCIVGDGETQEGQIWEGVSLAARERLDHFVLFIDDNKKQSDGTVESIGGPFCLADKLKAFGFDVRTVKGYDVAEIRDGIERGKAAVGKPSAIILDTYKGLGYLFAEQVDYSHNMAIDASQAAQATAEIERRYAAGSYPGGNFTW